MGSTNLLLGPLRAGKREKTMSEDRNAMREMAAWTAYPLHEAAQINLASVVSDPVPPVSAATCLRSRSRVQNRREGHRTEARLEVVLRELAKMAGPPNSDVNAQIVNAGCGGLCIVSDRMLIPSSVVRCELPLANGPVRVPTLLQVRWTKQTGAGEYRTGLMYLV